MNRRDREIADPAEAIALLARCDTIRLGLNSPDGPYVVPLSFGLETDGERPIVYFHRVWHGRRGAGRRKNARTARAACALRHGGLSAGGVRLSCAHGGI